MIFEGTKKSIFFGLGLTRAGSSVPLEEVQENVLSQLKRIFYVCVAGRNI